MILTAMEKVLFDCFLVEIIIKDLGFPTWVELTELDDFHVLRDEAYRLLKKHSNCRLKGATFDDLLNYVNNVSDSVDRRCHSRMVWRQFDVSDYCRRCNPLFHHESMREIRKRGSERLGEALFITFFHSHYYFLTELTIWVLVGRLLFITNSIARMENLRTLYLNLRLGNAVAGKQFRFMPYVPRGGQHYPRVTFRKVTFLIIKWSYTQVPHFLIPVTTDDIDEVKSAFPNMRRLYLRLNPYVCSWKLKEYAQSLNINFHNASIHYHDHPQRNG